MRLSLTTDGGGGGNDGHDRDLDDDQNGISNENKDGHDIRVVVAENKFDAVGLAGYLAPYALALVVSLLVTVAFFYFVLL